MYDFVSVQPMSNRVGMVNYIKYNYGSNKGATAAGDTFMTSIYGGQSDVNYTAEDVVDEVVALDSGKANLAWIPVAPGSVKIAIDEGSITDNGNGALSGTGGVTGTIDYATGAITLTGTATNPVATYVYNNKYAPAAVPEVQLSIESLPVVAKDRTIKSLYSLSAALQFEKEYGSQVDTLMAAEVAGELAHKEFVA